MEKLFNHIGKIHHCIEQSRKKYGFENNYEIYVDLRDPSVNFKLSNYRWKGADVYSDYLKDFELWRSALMSGRLEKERPFTADYWFTIKTEENKGAKLEAMFKEVNLETKDLDQKRSVSIDNKRRKDGRYHAHYILLPAVFTTIDKLPEHLRKQRRELIFRRTQISRALSLLSILGSSISSYIYPKNLINCQGHGWDDFLENPYGRMKEVKELLLESNPLRFDGDLKRHTENLYDFLNVPNDARKKDYRIQLPEGG